MDLQKRHGGSLGFHWAVAKICGGDVACVECKRRENSGALPPFLVWGGVLATETEDPRITVGAETAGVVVEDVINSITE